jgi:hypothetical protein
MLTPASSFHGLGYRLRGYRAGSSLRSCGSILLTYKQAELQSLSGWAVNTWSRFARQRVCEAFPPNYCPPRTPTSTPALAPSPAPAPAPAPAAAAAPAPAPAPAAIERKNEAAWCWLQCQRCRGLPRCCRGLPRCCGNCQVRGRRRDDVAASDSARHNNNSALPTKLHELSSWDFLHSNSFSFASGTAP